MSHTDNHKLTFQPYSSILDPGFWQQLTNVKLNKLKLSQKPLDIYGSYSCNLARNLPSLASFDYSSFSQDYQEPGNRFTCPLRGQLICVNLMQELVELDKKQFLDSLGGNIWKAICNGQALDDPERYLSKFGLLVYADLKKYKFCYWFSFPALNYPKNVFHKNETKLASIGDSQLFQVSVPILDAISEQSLQMLQQQYDLPKEKRSFQRGYFIVALDEESNVLQCLPLSLYKNVSTEVNQTIFFAYTDPSDDPNHPGWPLRNYLALIAMQFNISHVQVIRIRRGYPTAKSSLDLQHSMVIKLRLEISDEYNLSDSNVTPPCPLVTGWERNELQQMAPKRVNLSSLLDPKKLAEDAVNLNLRLMKWRLMPGLDLEKIANTKCLLLGCGTLGCHIARGLLAWGVKNISLVDNSKISYSNPVRQSLYTFDDCLNQGSGVFKADAAAASLERIHPTVNVNAHVLSIPMPGHHVAKNELDQTKTDVARLEELIQNHDTVFLLMDTRESRWLPTVIALLHQKLVINAAIGFDTFLLQRFGVRDYSKLGVEDGGDRKKEQNSTSSTSDAVNYLASDQLGCYFCNDIVAPGDSTLDRTLDQQCTVSRPGVSMMVSALAIELLTSVICSKHGSQTPAPIDTQPDQMVNDGEDFSSELGMVPHSIRGNLNRFHIYMPTSPSFNKCSACSPAVVRLYREQGFEFLSRVFDDPSYLEEITGLKDLQNVSDDVWALDSDDTFLDDSV